MKTRPSNLPLLAFLGIGLFLVGCLLMLVVPLLLLDPIRRVHVETHWKWSIVRITLDCFLVVAALHVSHHLEWRKTRAFWWVVISYTVSGWLIAGPVCLLVARWDAMLGWGVHRAWPWVFGVLLIIWLFSSNRSRAAAFWRPVDALLRGCGFATILVAIVLPARVGILAYSMMSWNAQIFPVASRLRHVPAPAGYAGLTNPFEDPQFCVELEDAGLHAEAVRQVVQEAVPNRSAARASELAAKLPRTILESADVDSANVFAERLRDAGATCSVRDALDVFVASVAADRETSIGRPSQVLDNRFLSNGRDSIADLRDAIAKNALTTVKRDLAKQAFIAFTTAEGRALYQTNCRSCHGTKGSGDGPVAAGFSPRPANFHDPTGLSVLTPGEVLWRIEEGGPGLPSGAAPWNSSMPAWKHDLDRELLWKIILGEFNIAGAQPRAGPPLDHARTQPVQSTTGSEQQLPERSWLEWPVPPKPAAEAMSDPQFVTHGKYLYYFRCMPCHGVTGHGDGPAANTMWPRPRDFTDIPVEGMDEKTQPKFKFRTTKYGWLPTDEDLYRTISRGLVGTAMEGWNGVLKPDEIWQVITYLKTLSPSWNDPEHSARNPNDPIVVREFTELDSSSPILNFVELEPPPLTRELIKQGEETFRRIQCWQCHGIEARGDGLALGQHFDSWGYRAWPQNLASPVNFKAGHSMKEIYRDITAGLDGSVMPTLPLDALDPKDLAQADRLRWALAAYIHSQVKSPHGLVPGGYTIVNRVRGSIPLDPLDSKWDSVSSTTVPLSGQVLVPPRWTAPSVNQITVKAACNGESIAIWLRWDDRRPNVTHQDVPSDWEPLEENPLGPKTYTFPALTKKTTGHEPPVVFNARDQLELQWPCSISSEAEKPFFFYGDERNPVVLWRWLADRQGLMVTKQAVDIGGAKAERLECNSRDSDAAATTESAVQTFRASGPQNQTEVIRAQPSIIRSRAHWANGAWTLVLSRPLNSDAEGDVELGELSRGPRRLTHSARAPIPVAVHVWDGLAGETGLRMAISSWFYLEFEQPRPMWHHGFAAASVLLTLIIELFLARWYRRRVTANVA